MPLYDDRVYAKGGSNLYGFIREGVLLHEDEPCLYVYQQKMGDHVQAGLVGLCSVEEYEDGLIKKHEFTRKDKEDDRTRHVTEQNANAEPVFLTYQAAPGHRRHRGLGPRAGRRSTTSSPSDGIGHTVWASRTTSSGSRLETPLRCRSRRSTSPTATTAPPPPSRTGQALRAKSADPTPARSPTTTSWPWSSPTTSCRSWTTTAW